MNKEQVIAALSQALKDFVTQLQMWKSHKVQWCIANDSDQEWGKVYVRRAQRLINRKITQCLDLASIEIHEDLQGQGIASAILDLMEEINPWDTVYVENVLNEDFANTLRKRGYVTDRSGGLEGPPCLYKTRQAPTT